MKHTLIEVLQELEALGFSHHIYQNNDGLWCHNGQPIERASEIICKFWFDESTDERISVYGISSACGLKGTAVMGV